MAIPRNLRKWKLGPAGEKGILLGYENNNTPYRILRLKNKKVAITKQATFDKSSCAKVDQGLLLTNPTADTNQQQFIVEMSSVATVDGPCERDNQSLPLDMVNEFHAKDTSPAIQSTSQLRNKQLKHPTFFLEGKCPTNLLGCNTSNISSHS
ncbi:hypothetical protein O181_044469 [Austropuccinia psidii MF-1]|uniref:Retroviral polymerase SH3-like domain-containing protein n=1 Tax=Austropuccinia psidii MF-1 TaxID=1389203 RepID=A0A9Q3DK32_9BASI|nr:hypothetical protein [Austropuccinia psidii MF-1]